ncbi:HlyD family type I secretion periplasmic adaptor subunit [Devosia sp. RR2S18]|uniref:HlyD family type I secretion periplasmic adaptor subunit n=1 Tax=Devosia rhizosphaerae TaxID=3049774 RepID=UPI0025421C39|nr:HlyD family type I secretion periplasmic adaptor subunit [Devosia sp. RR2S18]WIJ24043.1 HlyD family type I secretion periplasmic adaptor subunit [Devosia sp. RR2S18]
MSATTFTSDEPNAPRGKAKEFSPRPYVMMGYATILMTFGVFGVWAATAPLAAGVVAGGTVSVESSRKIVQHLEGGIVEAIHGREGEIVEAGEVVLELDATEAQGNVAYLAGRMYMLQAQQARLEAESTNAEGIVFPEVLLNSTDSLVTRIVTLQQTLFNDRKASKDGQIAIFTSRIDQLEEAIRGMTVQKGALEEQMTSLNEEVARLTQGQESGVVATNQLSSMTRSVLQLQGELGSVTSEIAKLRQSISESELQIIQVSQEFVERAGTELRDVREQLNETTERYHVALDVLERTTVRAPVRGMLQNIKVHTIGGVIRPAEPVMDIIPLDDDLVIAAQIRPIDIDSISIGQEAEVRFPAFSTKSTPAIFGRISVVSQDVIEPTQSNELPYYSARIEVADTDVPQDIRERLLPGMPVDVIVSTGERTMFEYFVRPMTDMFHKGMREQ